MYIFPLKCLLIYFVSEKYIRFSKSIFVTWNDLFWLQNIIDILIKNSIDSDFYSCNTN